MEEVTKTTNKKILTEDIIVQECKSKLKVIVWLFTIVGLGVIVYALFNLITNPCINTMVTFFVYSILFGIPFGYVVGIKNLIFEHSLIKKIRQGKYYLFIDEVSDIELIKKTTKGDGFLYFKETKKSIPLFIRKGYYSFEIGEKCILLFTADDNKIIKIFRCKDYEASPDLEKMFRKM